MVCTCFVIGNTQICHVLLVTYKVKGISLSFQLKAFESREAWFFWKYISIVLQSNRHHSAHNRMLQVTNWSTFWQSNLCSILPLTNDLDEVWFFFIFIKMHEKSKYLFSISLKCVLMLKSSMTASNTWRKESISNWNEIFYRDKLSQSKWVRTKILYVEATKFNVIICIELFFVRVTEQWAYSIGKMKIDCLV